MKKIQFTSKRLTRIILSMLALCLTFKGCYTVSEEIQSVLVVTKNAMDFTFSGAEDNFNVTSNYKWTVTKDASWITVYPSSGSENEKVTVIAEPNTNANTEPRTATITVSNGISDKTRTIHVTQNSPSLSLSESSLNFSANTESKSFNITSNTTWTVSSTSSWLTVSLPSGSHNATINVTAATNSSTSQRTATITVSGGEITPTIAVTQSGITSFSDYTETTNGLNLALIAVSGGTFTMVCTSEQGDCDSVETPTHQVTLSDFYIGKYEVTQGQWRAIMGNNPSYFTNGDKYPVECVSWDDIVGTSGATMVIKNITYYANGFIYKLNQLTGRQYRLPTEAEWEFAARGGRSSNGYKYSGSNTVGNVAWYWENSGNRTHAVGGKSANELGIYDMSGNVYEWCSDWWGVYSSNAQTDPTGPSTNSIRVARGGSWNHDARSARVSYRSFRYPDGSGYHLGFRLARSSN